MILWFCFAILPSWAQPYSISGKVVDAEAQRPLPAVIVNTGTMQAITDDNGEFSLQGFHAGEVLLDFTAPGFRRNVLTINLQSNTDLGVIELDPATNLDALSGGLSEVSISSLDTDDDSKGQNISGLLHSSNDVFVSTAAYTFGPAYFRMRGYDADLNTTYIGNTPISDAETGRTLWALWGGLNDATRNNVSVNGLSPARFSFGNVGGVTNIITRASQQRIQTKLTYSSTNRTYRNRAMIIHSTGLMPNNWAVTISGSRRWGNGGYVEGTFYDAWAWFLGLERKFNDKHTLALTTFAAPVERGMQGGATQEVYDLLGDNYYSPNWGYQNGEKRNSRVRTMNQPVIILNHYWNPGSRTQITNTFSYLFGRTGTTAFNWYKSADPRPDYYRNLPSWATDSVVRAAVAHAWKTDPSVSQVDWDALYQANYLAKAEGKQARYIIEDRRNDQNQLNFSSFINHELNDNIKVSGGIELSDYTGSYFKTINDLLGGSFWVDIDQFAERDFTGNTTLMQNDLDNPNRIVTEGDIFGYNYELRQQSGNIWAFSDFSYRKVDFYLAGQLSATTFWRHGFMRNGRHPDNSLGESKKNSFLDYAFKTGAVYKITGRHFLEGNVAYLTRAPYMRNAFISPRTRHDVVPDITSEKVFSTELTYHLRMPNAKARITAYHTMFSDLNEINSFYHDDYLTLVNYVMYSISKTHQGIEMGAEVKLFGPYSLMGAFNLGNYRYTNRPEAIVAFDNGSKPDTTKLIYSKYFYVSGTPQTAGSLGIKYAGPRYLYINANVNYYDNIWLDFNPERRTQLAIQNLGEGDPRISAITRQEKLPNGYTVDVSIGKSYRIKNKFFLNINFSVSNILNNKEVITGGYEQLRFDFAEKNVNKFPPRYFYYYGTTYFLNLGLRY